MDQIEMQGVPAAQPRLSHPVFICLSDVKVKENEFLRHVSATTRASLESIPITRSSIASISLTRSVESIESIDSIINRVDSIDQDQMEPSSAKRSAVPDSQKTTVMIRNIPCGMTQTELLQEVELATTGLNFLFLPQSRKRAGNLGYAFVNYVSPSQAVHCIEAFQGKQWSNYPRSKKQVVVEYAGLQGFRENKRYYRRSKITAENRPFIKRAD
jgi:hypothetical protein